MMSKRRFNLFAAGWLLMLISTPAWPHASAVRTSPSANSSVKSAPRSVAIFFSEKVQASADAIVVRDDTGTRVDLGDARSQNNGRVIRTSLRPLDEGTYRVNWRIRSADGHTAEGGFTFRIQK